MLILHSVFQLHILAVILNSTLCDLAKFSISQTALFPDKQILVLRMYLLSTMENNIDKTLKDYIAGEVDLKATNIALVGAGLDSV